MSICKQFSSTSFFFLHQLNYVSGQKIYKILAVFTKPTIWIFTEISVKLHNLAYQSLVLHVESILACILITLYIFLYNCPSRKISSFIAL